MPTVFPLDEELVYASAKKTGKVIVFEEHFENGGLGTIVTEALSGRGIPVRRKGIPNVYATTCGDYEKLLAYYHLDPQGIADAVAEWIKEKDAA